MFQIKRKLEAFCRENNLTLQGFEQIGQSTFFVDVLTSGFFAVKQVWKVHIDGSEMRGKIVRG